MEWPPGAPGTWVLDLDGVVWRAGVAIPGAPEAIAALRQAGNRVVFVTNNAGPTVDEFMARLKRAEIPAEPDDLLGSAHAAAGLLQPGERAWVIGEEGIAEALRQRGVIVVDDGPAEVVSVSRDPHFTYAALDTACTLVRGGARLIATSDDATHPSTDRLLPGTGSILAAVSTAAGVAAAVAGKPHPPMVSLVRERVGDVAVVVGDRPSTDGRLAQRLGAPYALVLSGVTAAAAGADPRPDAVAADLAALVASALARSA